MDIASISAAIGAVTSTTKLIGAAIDKRDSSKLNELKIAMTEQLLQLSTAAMAVNEKLVATQKETETLEKEIKRLREQLDDQSHFELCSFKIGTHAYIDKRMGLNKKPVFFCAACMTEGKKSILQPMGFALKCPNLHPDIRLL